MHHAQARGGRWVGGGGRRLLSCRGGLVPILGGSLCDEIKRRGGRCEEALIQSRAHIKDWDR
jgi:hypothetical protein